MTNQTFLFSTVLHEAFGSYMAAGKILFGLPVKQFAIHNWYTEQVGIATVGGAGATSNTNTCRNMHSHDLSREQVTDLVVNRNVVIATLGKDLSYPYTFHSSFEVQASLLDMLSNNL